MRPPGRGACATANAGLGRRDRSAPQFASSATGAVIGQVVVATVDLE